MTRKRPVIQDGAIQTAENDCQRCHSYLSTMSGKNDSLYPSVLLEKLIVTRKGRLSKDLFANDIELSDLGCTLTAS